MKSALAAALSAATMLAALPAAADGDPEEGKKVFRQCQACHTMKKGQHRLGPSLVGIVGREAGSVDGFGRYSPAMKDSDVVWNEENLHKYLENPKDFIPGNRMAFPGVSNKEDRENVIAYLKQASGDE